MESKERLLKCLTNEWQSTSEIATRFGTNFLFTQQKLYVLLREGKVKKSESPGKATYWKLPDVKK